MWRAPFSIAAAISCASIGAHFYQRLQHTHDEWAQAAYTICAGVMGMLTIVETLQVWQELGFATEAP